MVRRDGRHGMRGGGVRRGGGRAALVARAIVLAAAIAAAIPGLAAAHTLRVTLPWSAADATTHVIPGAVDRTTIDLAARYAADLDLDVRTGALAGTVTIDVENVSGAAIDRVELNTVMGPLGDLHLGLVAVDGTETAATLRDQTILVPLGGVLPPRATARLVLAIAATVPRATAGSAWLFSRSGGVFSLYRWLPWVSLETPFDRPNHGDPFVTPVTVRAEVTIRTSAPLRFAGTGTITASADGRTHTIVAADVRDVVLTAAADYRWRDERVGNVTIRVATRAGSPLPAAALAAAAKRALTRMEALVGPYPYPTLTIAQSSGGFGMEGPGVAWIPPGVDAGNLAYLVTHEVAHQWFYGIVGSDQAREPFADEAAADFLARHVLALRRGSRCAAGDLDGTIYTYTSECYYETVYIQGGNLIEAARQRLGDAVFWPALRAYVEEHRFGVSSTRALLDALDAATPDDLRAGWRARFPRVY